MSEYSPDQPSSLPEITKAMLRDFILLSRQDEQFWDEASKAEWELMSDAERQVFDFAQQHAFPDDLEARSNANKAVLAANYMARQVRIVESLEQQFYVD